MIISTRTITRNKYFSADFRPNQTLMLEINVYSNLKYAVLEWKKQKSITLLTKCTLVDCRKKKIHIRS